MVPYVCFTFHLVSSLYFIFFLSPLGLGYHVFTCYAPVFVLCVCSTPQVLPSWAKLSHEGGFLWVASYWPVINTRPGGCLVGSDRMYPFRSTSLFCVSCNDTLLHVYCRELFSCSGLWSGQSQDPGSLTFCSCTLCSYKPVFVRVFVHVLSHIHSHFITFTLH